MAHPAQISPTLLEQIVRQVQEEEYLAKDDGADVNDAHHARETEKAVETMLKYWNGRMVRWLKKELTFPHMLMTGYQVPRLGGNVGGRGGSLKVGSTQVRSCWLEEAEEEDGKRVGLGGGRQKVGRLTLVLFVVVVLWLVRAVLGQ
tara:strand:+ start:76 stop:513 length:438 start_codon:yes stop_codon:yes gene_type:complete